MPGKTTTPRRRGEAAVIAASPLGDLEGVVLDDRVGEELAAHVVDLGAGGLCGEARAVDGEIDDLADADAAHTLEAEVGERPFDGCSLGVEDALLGDCLLYTSDAAD